MARKEIIVDDLDGSTASESILFAFEGTQYEIDLSTDHAEELRAALAPYVKAARVVSRARVAPRPRTPIERPDRSTGSKEHRAAIRAWAKQNGHAAPSRGQIPAATVAAFNAAHA